MRWKVEKQPPELTQRVRRVFLWFPRCFSDEYRWLEYARVLEVYAGYGDWAIVAWADNIPQEGEIPK